MELLRSPVDEVQSKRSKCEVTIRQLGAMVGKIEELEMKDGLLVDDAGWVGKLQRRLDAQEKGLDSTKRALKTKDLT